ncbi:MAG: glutathione S-transferase [Pseudomonadota bacterium]|nr:glutathione S-transferase [Pseudomonadota bacterium]MED5436978.1 glutathione S-transferase [Pseudomonadota bacterium]
MENNNKTIVIGVPASPYTRKMLALLRYRRIPYKIIWGNTKEILDEMGLAAPKPLLLPVFIFPNEKEAICDSTPIIRQLETQFGDRNVIPEDKALAFINSILEDFGDEWVTKFMFHYRWHFKEDINNAGNILPLLSAVNLDDESHETFKNYISELQVSRLWVVGSNDKTAQIIEESYKRLLVLLEDHFKNSRYLLGSRPSSSDFSFYGQMTQLIGFDPTSRALALEVSPRSVAWVDIIEDLSGLSVKSNDWFSLEDAPNSLHAIFEEIGKGYVPAMVENSKALSEGLNSWKVNIKGAEWEQKVFPYQAKCLQWIKDEFNSLEVKDKKRIENFLANTGCENLIS